MTSINNEKLIDDYQEDGYSQQFPVPSYDGQSQLSSYHSSKNPTRFELVTNHYDYSKMSSINTEDFV